MATMAFALPTLLAICVLATDLGMAYMVRTELSNASDMVALSAIKRFAKDGGNADFKAVRQVAQVTAQKNYIKTIGNVKLNASSSKDIVFGRYNLSKKTFTPIEDPENSSEYPNAIQVTVNMDDASGNLPFTYFMAKVPTLFDKGSKKSKEKLSLSSTSTASLAPNNIETILDLSSSMDNWTYQPVSKCADETLSKQDRWFINGARINPSEPNTDGISCIGPKDPGAGVVRPEPISKIAKAIDESLLEENRLFKTYYRAGFITYETDAKVLVELDEKKPNNKEAVEKELEKMVDRWTEFAASNATATDLIKDPNPGGINPPHTGFTNTARGLEVALNQFKVASSNAAIDENKIVILATDGLPNCSNERAAEFKKFADLWKEIFGWDLKQIYLDYFGVDMTQSCSNHPWWYTYGMRSVREMAQLAQQDNIIIHSVYFDTNQEGACSPSSRAYRHLNEDIAQITGGKVFCTDKINCSGPECLSQALKDLANDSNFFIVRTD